MVRKIPQLRIFDDAQGKMNISLNEIQGEILLISQFTLYGIVEEDFAQVMMRRQRHGSPKFL